MCGIAALLRRPDASGPPPEMAAMIGAVSHRGPDGEAIVHLSPRGEELSRGAGWRIAMGHRRLSIIDLSEGGRQPMRRGRCWITYNGEIYNYPELKAELERLGHRFVSTSDTEVLLAAYEEWGVGAFARLKGMWGLVLADFAKGRVIASRDRLGIKPLYLAERNGTLAFCSELKQLSALGFSLSPDPDALSAYLATGYEDQRRTFFEGVTPLPPGTCSVFDLEKGTLLENLPYWFPERVRPEVRDRVEAKDRLLAALQLAVRQHLRADVPVGCALSGGLDSSSVAALVAGLDPAALLTFTATFPDDPSDERRYVDHVLGRLPAAKPHFVTPDPRQFLEELDRFVFIHDEPVGSLSQYAGWCVARITREAKVPVTLNGQGGDEVLAGYWQSYFTFVRSALLQRKAGALLSEGLGFLRGGNLEALKQVPVMLKRYRSRAASAASTPAQAALQRVLQASDQERRVFEIRELYLPRLLKWDDRNFMAFSVEGRYPFLDHELIETSLSFDPKVLYRGGWVKEPLREAMTGKLPDEIVRRRTKLGFETPQLRWLSGPLRQPLEQFLAGKGPIWAQLDREAMRAAFTRALSGDEESAQAVFRAFLADRWLTVHFESRPQARAGAVG
ncbi:MAG: asparagine synthase (glutamine-hydrolyzing) [Myxococcaceae bacterium]